MKIGLFGIDSSVKDEYFENLKDNLGKSLKGIYSPNHQALLPISEKHQVKLFISSDDLFSKADAIMFCKFLKPNLEFAIKAIKNSCHLFIEDISGIDINDLKHLFKFACEAGVYVHIKQTKCFAQEYIELSDYIENPKFIEINLEHTKLLRKQEYYNLLFERLVFIEALVNSNIKKLTPTAIPIDVAHFSHMHISLVFDNGAEAILTINNLSSSIKEVVSVHQKNCSIEMNLNEHFAVKHSFLNGQVSREEYTIEEADAFKNEITHFTKVCSTAEKEHITESPSILKTIYFANYLNEQLEQYSINF